MHAGVRAGGPVCCVHVCVRVYAGRACGPCMHAGHACVCVCARACMHACARACMQAGAYHVQATDLVEEVRVGRHLFGDGELLLYELCDR